MIHTFTWLRAIYSQTKSYDPPNDCYTRLSSGYITRVHTGKTRHCYALSRAGTMVPRYCAVLCDIVRYCAISCNIVRYRAVLCQVQVSGWPKVLWRRWISGRAVKPMTIRSPNRSSQLPVKDYRCSQLNSQMLTVKLTDTVKLLNCCCQLNCAKPLSTYVTADLSLRLCHNMML